MKSKTALIRGGIFFCVAGALSGCATNSMTRSGFLGDYEKLSPTRYENVLMYRAADSSPSVMPLSWWKKRRSRPPRVASMGSMTRSSAKC